MKTLPNLKALNKMVVDYSLKKIEVNLEQYDGYIDKLGKLPCPSVYLYKT